MGKARRIVVRPAVEMPVGRLQFWTDNPRWLPEEGEAALTRSMLEDPQMLWAKPLLVEPDGTVLWGNQRLLIARRLGWKRIPASTVSGLTRAQAATWALRDNNHYGLWDRRPLGEMLAELSGAGVGLVLTGFLSADLDRYLDPFLASADPDDAPALLAGEPESRVGCQNSVRCWRFDGAAFVKQKEVSGFFLPGSGRPLYRSGP